jgi:hypothetical protein
MKEIEVVFLDNTTDTIPIEELKKLRADCKKRGNSLEVIYGTVDNPHTLWQKSLLEFEEFFCENEDLLCLAVEMNYE